MIKIFEKKYVKKFVKFVKAFDKTENGVDTFLTFFYMVSQHVLEIKEFSKIRFKKTFSHCDPDTFLVYGFMCSVIRVFNGSGFYLCAREI